jgi:hypothetical protein
MLNVLSALLLFAVIAYFFKALAGPSSDRRTRMEEAVRRAKMRAEERRAKKPQVSAEDMIQCTVCDAYIPASNTSNCGKEGCPY